jgi:hypothetical protein
MYTTARPSRGGGAPAPPRRHAVGVLSPHLHFVLHRLHLAHHPRHLPLLQRQPLLLHGLLEPHIRHGRPRRRLPHALHVLGFGKPPLESRAKAAARWDLYVSAGWVSPSSRGMWSGDALLLSPHSPLQVRHEREPSLSLSLSLSLSRVARCDARARCAHLELR